MPYVHPVSDPESPENKALDALGVGSFSKTEARRRLSKAIALSKRIDGLPSNSPAEVETRTCPAFNPEEVPQRNDHDDLSDYYGGTREINGYFLRHGALIDVAVYMVTGVGAWYDRELHDIHTVWMGNAEQGPLVRVNGRHGGWFDMDGNRVVPVVGEDWLDAARDEDGEMAA